MNYQEALLYIKECTKFGIKLGLKRMTEILNRLNNPQDQYKIIHIAGTNGKGSTVSMFGSVLQQAGYRVARYNSPHLVTYRERFVVNGVLITKNELAEIVTVIKPVLESVISDGYGEPTEFEVGTAIAFTYFAVKNVDLAIIEVGMGGRFDATNVVKPILSVITHIALDHQEYLGSDLEKIAFEKAGIIKPEIPLVIGKQDFYIQEYLRKIAVDRNTPVTTVTQLEVNSSLITENGTEFTIENSFYGFLPIKLGLIGEHQIDNCLNLLASLDNLKESGINITKEQLLAGLAQVTWPGRMERITSVTPIKLYLDGAHNPDGVKALTESIRKIFPGQKVDLLLGILNNRPLEEIARILSEIANKVIITRVPDPKSASLEDVRTAFLENGVLAITEPSPDKALKILLNTDNRLAVATGSLYLIGYLRGLLYSYHD